MKPAASRGRQWLLLSSLLLLVMPLSLALSPSRVASARPKTCLSRASAAERLADPSDPSACPANLTAYWKLDEAGGPPYVDSALGHDGHCTAGHCPTAVTGLVHGAQAFDTTTQVTATASSDFDWAVNASFSIEFWMQTVVTSTTQVVIGRNDSGNNLHWWVGSEDTNRATFVLHDTGNTIALAQGTTNVTDGQWHHIAAIRDAAANELRLYVDGTLEATTPVTYAQGFASATAPVDIGWFVSGLVYHFSGIVDELAVYSRALTPTEIQQHIANNQAGYGVCETVAPQYSVYLPVIVR